MFRFRHREATSHIATNQRRQVALLLIRRSMSQQDLHISNVRSLTVKKVVTNWGAAQFFTYMCKLGQAETQPTVFFWQMWRPHTASFYLLAFFIKDGYQI